MRRRRIVLAGLFVVAAGCNRQDAETLGRIGDKLMNRAKAVAPVESGKDKLTVALPGLGQDDARPGDHE
jgi:hypothetical protein